MSKYAVALAIIISLSGCTLFSRLTPEDSPPFVSSPVYSAPEIDAINARARCRQLARNMVEVARCDG